jgi:hypothetical protein
VRPHSKQGTLVALAVVVSVTETHRIWVRFHINGKRAVVYEIRPGVFTGGCSAIGALPDPLGEIGDFRLAKNIADAECDCVQNCSCAPWTRLSWKEAAAEHFSDLDRRRPSDTGDDDD